MGFQVRAVRKYVPHSPQKVRLVIDQIRGLNPDDALTRLRFMPQAAAKPVAKLVASAVANAEENFGLAREDLYISYIVADPGPIRRWRRFGARGRFKPIRRRSSHITVVLEEYEDAGQD
ncbi:MAG TPA: 50S ribosomal protein L22 [Anaerolineae bacterium]|nr:50S ribosomal protein L22 [Anaerolineae bacterium]HIQ04420.1 50S ribosomal protein L22 [Anaerolineae bacterium]